MLKAAAGRYLSWHKIQYGRASNIDRCAGVHLSYALLDITFNMSVVNCFSSYFENLKYVRIKYILQKFSVSLQCYTFPFMEFVKKFCVQIIDTFLFCCRCSYIALSNRMNRHS